MFDLSCTRVELGRFPSAGAELDLGFGGAPAGFYALVSRHLSRSISTRKDVDILLDDLLSRTSSAAIDNFSRTKTFRSIFIFYSMLAVVAFLHLIVAISLLRRCRRPSHSTKRERRPRPIVLIAINVVHWVYLVELVCFLSAFDRMSKEFVEVIDGFELDGHRREIDRRLNSIETRLNEMVLDERRPVERLFIERHLSKVRQSPSFARSFDRFLVDIDQLDRVLSSRDERTPNKPVIITLVQENLDRLRREICDVNIVDRNLQLGRIFDEARRKIEFLSRAELVESIKRNLSRTFKALDYGNKTVFVVGFIGSLLVHLKVVVDGPCSRRPTKRFVSTLDSLVIELDTPKDDAQKTNSVDLEQNGERLVDLEQNNNENEVRRVSLRGSSLDLFSLSDDDGSK